MPLRPTLIALLVAGLAAVPAAAEMASTPQQDLEAAISAVPLSDATAESKALREFYRERGKQLPWSGTNEARGFALMAEMQAIALAEGLSPAAYTLPASTSDARHDVMLSANLMRFGRDLAIGAVWPERAYGGFGHDTRGHFDQLRFLRDLADGKSLTDLAAAASPRLIGYARLKQALEQTRAIVRAGGWPSLPDGPKLVPGQADDRIPLLRKRLIASGELDAALSDGRDFDPAAVEAVKRFQARHGLETDGAVGAKTLANLNVSAEARARQIAVNMERWRWMTRDPGRQHVAVNIAAAMLNVVEDGAVTLSMRVVVGDVKHPTPSMNASMNSLVLNPPWSVPPSIANKEILPKLRRDPNYLVTSKLKITQYPSDSPEAVGDGINWNAIGRKFPYRLRQPPGPDNALGLLKFNLKDSDDIYLHDTNNRKVFAKPYRALSHGCVRLERPIEMGERMLGGNWRGRLMDNITANASTRTLMLERTVPVYFLYITAWSDDEGVIHFRDDLYGHDRRLTPVLDRARLPLQRTAAAKPDHRI